jgi:hypothetical protein
MTNTQKEAVFFGCIVGVLCLLVALVLSIGPINGYMESLDRDDNTLYGLAKGALSQYSAHKHWQIVELQDVRIERDVRTRPREIPGASVFLTGIKDGERRFWRLRIDGDYVASVRESDHPISRAESFFDDDREIVYFVAQ